LQKLVSYSPENCTDSKTQAELTEKFENACGWYLRIYCTADKGWSSNLGIGWGANKSPP
jgi:hypothetical protein